MTACKCSLRIRLVGDGCMVCQPETWVPVGSRWRDGATSRVIEVVDHFPGFLRARMVEPRRGPKHNIKVSNFARRYLPIGCEA